MGVRHLQTFIKKYVPNGVSQTDILAECNQYQKKYGRKPILVIDFLSLVSSFEKDLRIVLLGGRHNKNVETLEYMLQRLSSVARLVFFEDGPVMEQKLETWLRRNDDKYFNMTRIIDSIKASQPLELIVDREWFKISSCTDSKSFGHLARQYGKLIITVTKECDAELVKYANREPDVLAVLADDTDFLIFPGEWRLWSLDSLNKSSLRTTEYNKIALRVHLGLNCHEMKILATISGNDILPFETLREFQINNCGLNTGKKFLWLAQLSKSLGHLEIDELVEEIAVNLLHDQQQKDQIRQSIMQYNPNFRIPPETDESTRYCLENFLMCPYAILKGFPGYLTILYFDLREETSSLYTDSMFELRQKQGGILLKHRSSQPQSLVIMSKTSHLMMYKPFDVKPIYPEDQIPPLVELLDREHFPQHDELRFKLLIWMIAGDKHPESKELDKIPQLYFHDILTLVCLTSRKLITTIEADIILLTIERIEQKKIPRDLLIPEKVGNRPFQLVFLFSKFRQLVTDCLQVIGLYQSKQKLNNFDGVLFHNLYIEMECSGVSTIDFSDCSASRFYH